MPTYDYGCTFCNTVQEEIHSINEDPIFVCKICGKQLERKISVPNFILKGWSGWSSKIHRESSIRLKRNAEKASRTRERQEAHPQIRLMPNVAGEQVDTWSEAQRLAKSKGLNADSYDKLIKKEKD
jgi:putative FmdB family regulatory protein